MNRIINILILVGILAMIVIQLAQNKKKAENRVYKYDKESPINVFGEVVIENKSIQEKTYSGTFESNNEVKLNADIQGRISQVFVKEGQHITKGQPLLKIDDQMLQLQLNVLNTKLKGLKDDETRYSNLSKTDAVPAINLEKTINAIATVEAEKKTIMEQISKTTVRAPFSGVISMKFCEVGGFASPAIPLFEIINQSDLKFVINVPDSDLPLFIRNQNYSIRTYASNKSIVAQLSQVSSKGGTGNNFKIEFQIENSEGLKAGMFGELQLTSDETLKDALLIPSKSIIGSESNPEIYKVSNGKAVRTPILILSRSSDKLAVAGTIEKGDTIVTGGFINLFDNANVIVNE
ncbi:MAG: efflux RND transporter periplasmic adaptor subunit [Bacteroidetes bacterium]|nr:efflux RND transporter periplasmic adaptor subunit [Bacteroidota bacterium]